MEKKVKRNMKTQLKRKKHIKNIGIKFHGAYVLRRHLVKTHSYMKKLLITKILVVLRITQHLEVCISISYQLLIFSKDTLYFAVPLSSGQSYQILILVTGVRIPSEL